VCVRCDYVGIINEKFRTRGINSSKITRVTTFVRLHHVHDVSSRTKHGTILESKIKWAL